jgi:hypothetical protein
MRHRCVVFLREDDLTLQPMLEDVFHTAAAPDETIVAYEFQYVCCGRLLVLRA